MGVSSRRCARASPPPPLLPQSSLCNLLLFGRLDRAAQGKIAEHTWERAVAAGEILIQEGEVGLAATELFVVKSGKFEVRARSARARACVCVCVCVCI
jgi:cGMP-dependent protein kinase 2